MPELSRVRLDGARGRDDRRDGRDDRRCARGPVPQRRAACRREPQHRDGPPVPPAARGADRGRRRAAPRAGEPREPVALGVRRGAIRGPVRARGEGVPRGRSLCAGGARGLRLEPRRAPRRVRAAPRHGGEDAPRGERAPRPRRRGAGHRRDPRRSSARARHLHPRPRAARMRGLPREGLARVGRRVPPRDLSPRRHSAAPRREGAHPAGRNAHADVRRRPRAPLGSGDRAGRAPRPRALAAGDHEHARLRPLPGRLRRRDDPWARADRPPATPLPRPRAGGDAREGLRVRPVRAAVALDHGAVRRRPHRDRPRRTLSGKASGSSACPRRSPSTMRSRWS